MNRIVKLCILQALMAIHSSVVYGVEERIEFDISTGNYVIWEDVNGVLEPVTFIPATKINPSIMTDMHTKNTKFRYAYTIWNSKHSEQSIETIIINANGMDNIVLNSTEWKTDTLLFGGRSSTKVGLAYWGEDDGGIAPGEKLSFRINSGNLAGLGHISFQGSTPILKFRGYGVGPEIQAELDALMEPDKNSVHRYIVAPAIELEAEFNVKDVLRKMIAHVESLASNGVMDSIFVQALVRHLQAAIDASLSGNTPGVLHNLGLATSHLSPHKHDRHREHEDKFDDVHGSVRELLAKAYLFDIRYIRRQIRTNHKVDFSISH